MGILWILLDAVVLAGVVLIFVYLANDRRRFRVERQFSAVRSLFDEWVGGAAKLPGCEELAAQYRRTHNISKKYRLIGALTEQVDCPTEKMQEISERLRVFCGVYYSLAEDYNRHLMGAIREPITHFLGFRPLPQIDMNRTQTGDDHV